MSDFKMLIDAKIKVGYLTEDDLSDDEEYEPVELDPLSDGISHVENYDEINLYHSSQTSPPDVWQPTNHVYFSEVQNYFSALFPGENFIEKEYIGENIKLRVISDPYWRENIKWNFDHDYFPDVDGVKVKNYMDTSISSSYSGESVEDWSEGDFEVIIYPQSLHKIKRYSVHRNVKRQRVSALPRLRF